MRLISYLFNSILICSFVKASKFPSNIHAKRDVKFFDALGKTNYGFRCDYRTYPLYHLYATAKRACDKWTTDQERKIPGEKLLQTFVTQQRDAAFFDFHYTFEGLIKPYIIYPILTGEKIYEDGLNMSPGPDRIVVDSNCDLVAVLTQKPSSPPIASPRTGTSTRNGAGPSRLNNDQLDPNELKKSKGKQIKTSLSSDEEDSVEFHFHRNKSPNLFEYDDYDYERNTPGLNTPERSTPGRSTPGRSTPKRSSPRRSTIRELLEEDYFIRPVSVAQVENLSTIEMCLLLKRPPNWKISNHGPQH